ncbi:MAG: ACP S-malonyltransferase [Chloroflexi bacterium]|nr:ACP S-malonyltransferase [Chloroflexota bacterium]
MSESRHDPHGDTRREESGDTESLALVFPGQGSQAPGMGRLIYEHSEAARLTYEEASDILGVDIAEVCFESDADALASTENTQPAVLTTSIAMLRAMREKVTEVREQVTPRLMGGHSLGLFSAAVATGAISFRDSLLVIMERSRLMGSFNETRPVGMAAIVGLNVDTVREICEDATEGEHSRVDVANHNEDVQTVISGDVSALERAMERARELQGKAIRLKLKVSSHTPLHVGQAEEFAQIIHEVPFADPDLPIVSNITSELLRTAAEVRAEFEAQLKSPVLWAENVRRMTREGVDTFVEVGPGHALARMIKRIQDESTAVSLDDAREAPIPVSILPSRRPAS